MRSNEFPREIYRTLAYALASTNISPDLVVCLAAYHQILVAVEIEVVVAVE